MTEIDVNFLRASFAVARRARDRGNFPFGAVLVDATGAVLLEGENTQLTDRECTGHAELNLLREATARYDPDTLAGCTLYASAEPCPMCAGAIYWCRVGRLVFGLGAYQLCEITGDNPANPPLLMRCTEVFARGTRRIVVRGPALEREAAEVHAGFWRPAATGPAWPDLARGRKGDAMPRASRAWAGRHPAAASLGRIPRYSASAAAGWPGYPR
ncbi:MAG TPA: nucleoside deaminase [Gemmataceae bacterium]|nr:nucleoside deaminase [Gemmataceae bacterium]